MERIALFPGSFDPFTIGHESIVRRAFTLFNKIIIAIGYNSNKPGYFPLDKRIEWIQTVFKTDKNVEVQSYEGLTIDFCKKVHAKYILRGLRTSADFEYERAIAQNNKAMYPELESVFLLTLPEYTSVNSTIVRDIIMHGGDAGLFLPKKIKIQK
ncbi:MAG: pantetheine-phosphate adenylyltransferase [Bacteroidales bacterium]|nr:pantetheine-phosphate adenylyltransferase [Bacteroidales bacterium]